MKYFSYAVLAAALGATVASANSVDILETNAPGGDYADAFGAATNMLGAPPSGTTETNVIGRVNCRLADNCTSGRADPVDAFYFSLDANQSITEVSIAGNLSGTETLSLQIEDVSGALPTNLFTGTIGTNGFLQILTTANAPIGPGQYNVALGFFGTTVSHDFTYAYTITSTVVEASPVPLPAGLPLLVAGLGAFGLIRRRAKT